MVVSKHEAAQALQDIDTAQQRTHTMLRYRSAAPYFLLWGGIWLVANCITEFNPAYGGKTWRALALIGTILSLGWAFRQSRQHGANRYGWRFGAAWLVILGYFAANFALLPHMDAKLGNAYISLFWGFMYCLLGIWTGWRVLTVGLLIAASILVGYFVLTAHYFLWMGLVTGSLLILGGFWLRKV